MAQSILKKGAGSCAVGRLPAAEVEAAVVHQLRALLRSPEIIVGTWRAARPKVKDLKESDVREALVQLDPLWDELFPAEQARIVQLLVGRVDVDPQGLDIRLRVDGLSSLAREFRPSNQKGIAQ